MTLDALTTRSPFASLTTRLYQEAAAPSATPERPVVPLRRLILGQNLDHHELPNLSSRFALHFLQGRGALSAAWEEADIEPLAGFLYINESGGCVFVRREDPIARRRFAAAHEMGPYLLHVPPREGDIEFIEALPPLSNPDADEISGGRVTIRAKTNVTLPLAPEQMEHEADAFANALLMPEDVVRELATRYAAHCSDFDLIWRLSTEMLVSRAAMKVRLRHLGLLRGE